MHSSSQQDMEQSQRSENGHPREGELYSCYMDYGTFQNILYNSGFAVAADLRVNSWINAFTNAGAYDVVNITLPPN